MKFFAIGYIVRDPFIKPFMRVVVVRARCLDMAVYLVARKLHQFYKNFDLFINEGYTV